VGFLGVLQFLPLNSHSIDCSIYINHPIIDATYCQHR
jgi:hypothetical protein